MVVFMDGFVIWNGEVKSNFVDCRIIKDEFEKIDWSLLDIFLLILNFCIY